MTPKETVRLVCGEFYLPNQKYHRQLPEEVEPWYAYCKDSGHNIVCCLKQYYQPGKDNTNNLCPAPVKAVLRSYEIKDGYVVADLPYSSEVGLLTQPEDDE